MFPKRNRSLAWLNDLIKKTDETGSIGRCRGSDQSRTAHTKDNVDETEDLWLRQEGAHRLAEHNGKFHDKSAYLQLRLISESRMTCT